MLNEHENQQNIDILEKNICPLAAVPDKTNVKVTQLKTTQAPSKAGKSGVTLLEENLIVEDKENIYVSMEPPQIPWMSSNYLVENSRNSDDFLKESCFKGGSQERKNNSNNSELLLFEPGKSKISKKSNKYLNVDVLNKENVLQTSPKFSTLKFIDSPPSWKSVDENILKSPNAVLLTNEIEKQPIGKVLFVSKNKGPTVKGKALMQNPQKSMDMFSKVDKENMLPGMKAGTQTPHFTFEEHLPLQSDTRCNVSAMDLTMLPENQDQVDLSIDLEDIPINNEMTHNKTRLTMCDMEITCVFDQMVSEDASASSPKLDILEKSGFVVTQDNKNLRIAGTSSKQSNTPVYLEEDIPLSRYADNDRTQNKTKFSNYDMEMTCAFDQSAAEGPIFVSPQRSDGFSNPKTLVDGPKETEFDKSSKEDWNLCSQMLPEIKKHIVNDHIDSEQDLPLSSHVNEKTQNKTRFSTCDMEMTCAFDHSVNDLLPDNQLVSGESGFADVYNKNHVKAFEAIKNKKSLISSQETNSCNQILPQIPKKIGYVDVENNAPIGKCADEGKKHNKTRFSLCDMDITCTFNQSVEENSGTVSPSRSDKFGDFEKSNFVGTTKDNILKVFKATDLDKSLKSSQQSNFSFEEMDQLPSSDFIDFGSSEPACEVRNFPNSPMLFKDCERLQFENNHCFPKSASSEVLEDYKLSRLEQYNDPSNVASGRKYLKFYSDSEAENFNKRLQTTSPAKNLESSFMLKNKENLHLNRKRIVDPSDKAPGMPLRFRNKCEEVNSLARIESSKADGISKTSISEDAFDPSCRPEVTSAGQRTLLFRSEVMELTCHNLSLEENNEDFSNSIVQKVHVVTETEISSPGDVFPTGKFENTRYSTKYMDLTCFPEYQDSSEVLDCLEKAETPKLGSPKEKQVPPYFHLKEFSMADPNKTNSMNQSVRARQKMFKVITDDFSSSKPISLSTRQETSHNPHFINKDNSISVDQANDALVKNCHATEIVSSSPCVEVDTFQGSTKTNISPAKIVKKSYSEGVKNPSTPGIVYTLRKIKQRLKEANGNLVLFPEVSEALKKKQKFSYRYPYSEMKISSPMVKDYRQNHSFGPESQENSFTCLSGNKEVKSLCQDIENLSVLVSSPKNILPKVHLLVASPAKKDRTLSNRNCSELLPEAAMESKNSVSHLPRDGSCSPSFKGSSQHQTNYEKSVASRNIKAKSFCQGIDNLSVLVSPHEKPLPKIHLAMVSPERKHSRTQSYLNCSEVLPGAVNEPEVFLAKTNQSLSIPKDNYSMVSPEKLLQGNHSVSYAQGPSITLDDDSFQLLNHSALENSLMDSYSKKFTICLDRSTFVSKESVSNSPPKIAMQSMDENALASSSMFQNESVFRLSPKILKEDSIALPIADEPTISRKIPFTFPETNTNTSSNQAHLDISHKLDMASNFSSCEMDIQSETSQNCSSDFAARLKANALILQSVLKSSSASNTKGQHSPERKKFSTNNLTDERNEKIQSQMPNHSQNEDASTDQDAAHVVEENAALNSKNETKPSYIHQESQRDLGEDAMDTEDKVPPLSIEKSYFDVSGIPDTQSHETEEKLAHQEESGEELLSSNEDVSFLFFPSNCIL